MMQGRDLSEEAIEDDVEPFSPDEEEHPPTTRKKKSKNKRRFSDEQVRSLETIFESETKLEPRKKVQVARELGLQPRQVSIWFQNKRARWKSKQIEKNYRTLKSNYDNLKARFESMRREKDSLVEQLQGLQSILEKPHEGSTHRKDFEVNIQNITRENGDIFTGLPEKSSSLQEEIEHQGNDNSGKMTYLGQEESGLMSISEHIDGCIISSEKWCSFDAGNLFDQSSSSSHWWASWT